MVGFSDKPPTDIASPTPIKSPKPKAGSLDDNLTHHKTLVEPQSPSSSFLDPNSTFGFASDADPGDTTALVVTTTDSTRGKTPSPNLSDPDSYIEEGHNGPSDCTDATKLFGDRTVRSPKSRTKTLAGIWAKKVGVAPLDDEDDSGEAEEGTKRFPNLKTAVGFAGLARATMGFKGSLDPKIEPEDMVSDDTGLEDEDSVPEWLYPNSGFRNWWDLFVFIVVSYNCFFSPLQIMISYESIEDMQCYKTPQFWSDVVVDMLFWVDTVLNFFFAFVDPDTKTIITNAAAIRANFIHSSSFMINVIACSQPLFTVITCTINPNPNLMTALQLPRLMRMFLFMPQFNSFRLYLTDVRHKQINGTLFRMFIIFFFMLLGNTLLSCVYYFMGHVGNGPEVFEKCENYSTWVVKDPTWVVKDPTSVVKDPTSVVKDRTWVVSDPLLFPNCDVNKTVREQYFKNNGTLPEGYDKAELGSDTTNAYFIRSIYFMMQVSFGRFLELGRGLVAVGGGYW